MCDATPLASAAPAADDRRPREHRRLVRRAEPGDDPLRHARRRLERAGERGAEPVEDRAMRVVDDVCAEVRIGRRRQNRRELA